MNTLLFFTVALISFLCLGFGIAEGLEYKGSKYRDPFQLPPLSANISTGGSEQKVDPSQWRVEGLIWNSDSPQAIVNGNILQKGSRLGDGEVMRIDREGVILKLQGKEILLRQTRKDVP